jgi:hypothetical protein
MSVFSFSSVSSQFGLVWASHSSLFSLMSCNLPWQITNPTTASIAIPIRSRLTARERMLPQCQHLVPDLRDRSLGSTFSHPTPRSFVVEANAATSTQEIVASVCSLARSQRSTLKLAESWPNQKLLPTSSPRFARRVDVFARTRRVFGSMLEITTLAKK